MEEEDEDEVYSALLYALETTMGGNYKMRMIWLKIWFRIHPLEDIVSETPDNPLTDLCVADPTSLHVKNIVFGLERTLKINPSLSTSQEKELCSLLRKHLDAFAWSYKEMKGVHHSVCTHHI